MFSCNSSIPPSCTCRLARGSIVRVDRDAQRGVCGIRLRKSRWGVGGRSGRALTFSVNYDQFLGVSDRSFSGTSKCENIFRFEEPERDH